MTVILTITEPETDLLSLLFEVFSAIATVGISAGITSSLSVTGKAVIMILMFIGRLGPLSIYTAFHKEVRTSGHVRYPDANIIIG
jgi:trk system potassium uptake protein TrkH